MKMRQTGFCICLFEFLQVLQPLGISIGSFGTFTMSTVASYKYPSTMFYLPQHHISSFLHTKTGKEHHFPEKEWVTLKGPQEAPCMESQAENKPLPFQWLPQSSQLTPLLTLLYRSILSIRPRFSRSFPLPILIWEPFTSLGSPSSLVLFPLLPLLLLSPSYATTSTLRKETLEMLEWLLFQEAFSPG